MILNYLLDIIFPAPTPIRKVTHQDLSTHLRQKASPLKTPANWIFSGFHYQDKDVKKLVLHLKKYRDKRVAKALVDRLHEQLLELESEHEIWHGCNGTIIVPIPLHQKSLQKRGFNQSQLLANELAKLGINRKVQPLLKCVRATPKQALLRKTERIHNMKDSFKKTRKIIPEKHLVIIIDDVVTTGATLIEARLELARHIPAHNLKAFTVAH